MNKEQMLRESYNREHLYIQDKSNEQILARIELFDNIITSLEAFTIACEAELLHRKKLDNR